MKKIFLFIVALPIMGLIGCQSMPYQPYAREVKRMPNKGGEIALKTEHRDEDRAKAQSLMASNCGGSAVKVTEEGEVVVGQTTQSQASETRNNGSSGTQVGSLFGMPVTSGARQASNDTSTNATTTALKEWNIKYDCEKVVASSEVAPSAANAPATGAPAVKKTKKN